MKNLQDATTREKIENTVEFIHNISINYNIDKKNIMKHFLNYIIRNYPNYINKNLLNFIENLTHSQNQNNNLYIYYCLSKLSTFIY